MNLTQFINTYNGKKVDYKDKQFKGDGSYQCFTKDHMILMVDWTYKPIQDIVVGDKVIGYDNEVNTVTKTFKSIKEVVNIRTPLCDFCVTPDHPFYFKDGIFAPAVELKTKSASLYDKECFDETGLTDNELLFLGFWLGDGNIGKHKDNKTDEIRLTFGEKKVGFVHSLNILSSERPHHESKHAFVGAISKREHPLLTKIILEQCRGEYKKLPLIFSNRESELILNGFIEADGYKKGNTIVLMNTSLSLIYSLQAIAIKLGYANKSIRISKRSSEPIFIRGKQVKSVKPIYRLSLCKSTKRINERVKISEPFKAEVYNFETDNTHTYICNNYKVHNCVDLARQYVHDVYCVDQFPALGADGGAKDIFDKCTNLKKTVDSPTADYDKGDILIWDKSKTNKYGHVAILVAIYNTKYFVVFEQDGFKQDGAKLAFRSRENLRGALWRPVQWDAKYPEN